MGRNNEEQRMKPIRRQTTIDLSEYGQAGEIVLEELTVRREMEMNDRMGMCTVIDPENKTASTKTGTQMIYFRLGYVVASPHMSSSQSNTLDNWLRLMDRFDVANYKKLTARIDAEIRKLREDTSTPLAESEQAESKN